MEKNKSKLIQAKNLCNDTKIGNEIHCPSCNTKHIKKSYQSVFCKTKKGTKCKDNYWNNVDSNKRNNTTRISPANARYMENVIIPKLAKERGFPSVEDMNESNLLSGHALQCELTICNVCELRADYCRCGEW